MTLRANHNIYAKIFSVFSPLCGISSSITADNFSNKVKFFLSNTCILKIFRTFVLTNSITGRSHCPKNVGLFLCPIKYGSGVLLNVGESPHSPGKGLVSRKGITAFYLMPTLKTDAMTSILPSATGVSSAILAKSITYSNLLAGDHKVPRQGFFCSILSYQNQFNLIKTRRVA